LAELSSDFLAWTSFSILDQAIDELLADRTEVISEREAFLLRELQVMLAEEGLLGLANDVAVVPARRAWPEYQLSHAYICQANRTFQPVSRMAFYSRGQIQPLVPKVIEKWDSVVFERGKFSGWLGQLVDSQLAAGVRIEGATQKVFHLSGPDDSQTVKLRAPVLNDRHTEDGRPTAFTQNQRYVSLEKLTKASTTSQLLET